MNPQAPCSLWPTETPGQGRLAGADHVPAGRDQVDPVAQRGQQDAPVRVVGHDRRPRERPVAGDHPVVAPLGRRDRAGSARRDGDPTASAGRRSAARRSAARYSGTTSSGRNRTAAREASVGLDECRRRSADRSIAASGSSAGGRGAGSAAPWPGRRPDPVDEPGVLPPPGSTLRIQAVVPRDDDLGRPPPRA